MIKVAISSRRYSISPFVFIRPTRSLKLNTAALEIETGAYDPAISRLQGINLPEAWNNLGVAYAMKKDYTTAMQYFDQAAQAGMQDAAANGMSWPLGWPSNNGDTYLRI